MKRLLVGAFALLLGVGVAGAQQFGAGFGLGGVFTPSGLAFIADFTQPTLDPRLTFSRSGAAWDYNSAGAVTSFATNVPMLASYGGAGATNSGISLPATSTNFCLSSESPATKTSTITAGTYVIYPGAKDTGSIVPSGSGVSYTGSGTYASPAIFYIAASTSVTFTPSGTVTRMQCEKRTSLDKHTTAFAASAPIVTTTAAVSRNVDSLSIPLVSAGIRGTSGACVVAYVFPGYSNVNQTILDVNDGTTGNRYSLYMSQGTQHITGAVYTGGSALGSIAVINSIPVGYGIRYAGISWGKTGITVLIDGAAARTLSQANSIRPTTITIGNDASGGSPLGGYIQSVKCYPTAVDAATMQLLTIAPASLPAQVSYIPSFGQSLALGTKGVPPLTTAAPYPNCAYMLNDQFGTRGHGGSPIQASQITGFLGAFERDGPLVFGRVGETHMTSMMAQLCAEGAPGGFIARSDGQGGRTVAQISKENSQYAYPGFLTELARSIALKPATTTIKVNDVVFIQGEADASQATPKATYEGSVRNFATNVSSDSKIKTGQSNNPRFWIYQMTASSQVNEWAGSPISQAHYDLAYTNGISQSGIRVCGPNYDASVSTTDGVHNDAYGYRLMGARLGHCQAKEISSGTPWTALHPTTITFNATDRSKIEVEWALPVPPLVLPSSFSQVGNNATNYPAPNYGLSYKDDCGTLKVTGVTATSSTHTQIQLSGPSACANPYLRNAWDAWAMAQDDGIPTITNGGGGGTDGSCVLTANIDAANATAQATFDATISGGSLVSIQDTKTPGIYPLGDAKTWSSVPLSGCGLSGAATTIIVGTGWHSKTKVAVWSTIKDSDATVSWAGDPLPNRALVFNLPVAAP